MAEDKYKKRRQPPDIRLAQAFHFTADDLAANRSGYLSRRQQGWLLFALQAMFARAARRLNAGKNTLKLGFHPVASHCGRAQVEHEIINRMTQRPIFYEVFRLRLEGQTVTFALTAQQHRALSDGIFYRVYYAPRDPGRILSIERAEDGCSEDAQR